MAYNMVNLKNAVLAHQARIEECKYVEVDGKQVLRVVHFSITLKIAQAACNFGGYIVTGTRHYCPIMSMQIDAIGHKKLVKFAGGHGNIIQGFTDQFGNFHNREDAYVIAKNAGQLLPRHEYGETLYSESYI